MRRHSNTAHCSPLTAYFSTPVHVYRGAASPRLLAERLRPWPHGRARDRGRQADGLRVLQVGVYGGDDDASLDRDQVNADERDANPRVYDDALVQHAVEHVYQTGSAGCSLNSHVVCFL